MGELRSFQSNMEVMITMKKLFRKSIACLIAVLMVVSTMPFTALTVQAADTSALLSAMQSFEAKMDGSVYTNMDTAYNAYVAASKAYDAAYYGGDASVDVLTPATNLNNAVSQMTKTNLSAYTANNSTVPTFTDGDNGTVANSYVNLLYSGQGTASTVEVADTGDIRYTFQVGYNNTVMMYDGTAPRTRVMYMCRVPGKAASGNRFRNPMSCYPTTGSGKSDDLGSLYLVDKWKGGYNDQWNYPTQYNSGTYTFGHNSSTASAGRQIGSSWSGANPSKWFGYSNILEFNSNYNWNGSYLASFANVWWANWSGDNAKSNLLTDDSTTSIYVINYKPLKDAITADANSTARKNVASYKEGGMSTYLAGCLLAAGLNPNNYSYSTDLAGQASQCASDISTAVSKFTTAPTADNTENYPKLRSAFDYKGALTGFNNATYSVREAYNGGVNNGFTQASYDNFKAKYEAAQNVMKAVATTGYVNDGFAGDAATALLTAFNALQHEHSFTGAYVNNNDGTHSQKCAFYDKCQTLSTGVAHSYTSQVTTQPTCTTAGVTTYTCACGDSHTKDEPAATDVHNYTELVSEKQEATCTTPGKEAVYKCATCDLTTGGEEIPAPGHTWGDCAYNEAEDNHTEIRRCSVCNATEKRDCTYEETGTTTATCKVKGSTTYTCKTCNHSYTNFGEVNPDNHVNTTHHDGKAATCTENGWTAYEVCNDCKAEIGKTELKATGHSFTSYTQTLAPTCTTVGKEEAVCDNGCGTKNTRDVAIDSNNHTGLTTLEAVDATCISTGLTEGEKCTACGVTTIPQQVTDIDPDNHTDIVIDMPLNATCIDTGFTEGSHCEACGTVFVAQQTINALGHAYQYTELDADNHKVTCSRCDYEVQEAHNFEGGNTCTKCLYEKSTIDTTAYDNAVVEYEAIKTGDYTSKYTAESRETYETAVEAAKRDSFATQDEVNAAVAAILSAKTKLVYAQPEIKFVEVDANGNETVIETKNYTYGTPVEFTKDADNIAKWIVKTQNGKVETKVATSETTYTMIATEPATVYVHLTEKKTEAVQYSKVSFISKNGAVSSVQYVEVGKTLNTIDVPGVKIPFYEFKNWNKASVTADGSDIEVKAVYEFIGTAENKCNVHYNGITKSYTYDSFVYLFGAEGKKLALSTTNDESGIITYLNENAFYAPHTADIYVIEVDSQPASIGITGSYASSTETKKTAAFNCKFFLPEGCTVVEYGLTATSSTGKSMKIKGETASARGEYCVKVSMPKTSTVTFVEGVAYLTYKDAYNNLHTIYSTTVTQNL